MSALTAQPMTCPSPALIPDGVSTATIRLPVSFAALIFAIICSYLPVIVLDKPMPKTASIIQLYSPAGMSFTNTIPSFCKIAHCRFNSSVPFPSSAVVYTSAEIPRSVSWRATAMPSAPLLPLPHTHSTLSVFLIFSSTASVTQSAARSIKTSEGIPTS